MYTIALLAQKGGSGKTTTAVHLAVEASKEFEKIALIDIDPQKSAATWHCQREYKSPLLATSLPSELENIINVAKDDNIDLLIIDTPPHTAPATAKAAHLADFILIPCQPSPLDIAAIGPTIELAKATRKKFYVLISRAPSRSTDIQETRLAIKNFGAEICPIIIGDRTSFRRALAQGQAVSEFEPNGKSAAEINQLWQWIKKELNTK